MFGNDRFWQEWNQLALNANRSCTRSATAVRCTHRFVKIKMYNVKAHITWASNPHDGIGVRSVIIEKAAGFMHDFCNLYDLFFEQPKCAWIRQH
ncbi:hypothetical protein D3C75_852510 [compost metagenome]